MPAGAAPLLHTPADTLFWRGLEPRALGVCKLHPAHNACLAADGLCHRGPACPSCNVPARILCRAFADSAMAAALPPTARLVADHLALCSFGEAVAAVAGRSQVVEACVCDAAPALLGGRLAQARTTDDAVVLLAERLGFPRSVFGRVAAADRTVATALVLRVSWLDWLEQRVWPRGGGSPDAWAAAVARAAVGHGDTHLELAAWMRGTLCFSDRGLRLPGVLMLFEPRLLEGEAPTPGRASALEAHYWGVVRRAQLRESALDLWWPWETRLHGRTGDQLPDLSGMLANGNVWQHQGRHASTVDGALLHLFSSKMVNHQCSQREFSPMALKYCREFPAIALLLRQIICCALLGTLSLDYGGPWAPRRVPFARRTQVAAAFLCDDSAASADVEMWLVRRPMTVFAMAREYHGRLLDAHPAFARELDRWGSRAAERRCIEAAGTALRRRLLPGLAATFYARAFLEGETHAPAVGMRLPDIKKTDVQVLFVQKGRGLAGRWLPLDIERYLRVRWQWLPHEAPGKTAAVAAMLMDKRVRKTYERLCEIEALSKRPFARIGAWRGIEAEMTRVHKEMIRTSFKLRKKSFEQHMLERGLVVVERRLVDPCSKKEQTPGDFVRQRGGGMLADAIDLAAQRCAYSDRRRLLLGKLGVCGVSSDLMDALQRLYWEFECCNAKSKAVLKRLDELLGAADDGEVIVLCHFVERLERHRMFQVCELPNDMVRAQMAALRWRNAMPWWEAAERVVDAALFYVCPYCQRWLAKPAGSSNGPQHLSEVDIRAMFSFGAVKADFSLATGQVFCPRRKPKNVVTDRRNIGRVEGGPASHEAPDVVTVSSTVRRSRANDYPNMLRPFIVDIADHPWAAVAAHIDRATGNAAARAARPDDKALAQRHAAYLGRVHEQYKKYVASIRKVRCAGRCYREPAERVNLLGKIVSFNGRAWALCTLCAALAPFTMNNVHEWGFGCGCHTQASGRAPPRALLLTGHDQAAQLPQNMRRSAIHRALPIPPRGATRSHGTRLRVAGVRLDGLPLIKRPEGPEGPEGPAVEMSVEALWGWLEQERQRAGLPSHMVVDAASARVQTMRLRHRRFEAEAPQRWYDRARCFACRRPHGANARRLRAVLVVDDLRDETGRRGGGLSYDLADVRDDPRLTVAWVCTEECKKMGRLLAEGLPLSAKGVRLHLMERKIKQGIHTGMRRGGK